MKEFMSYLFSPSEWCYESVKVKIKKNSSFCNFNYYFYYYIIQLNIMCNLISTYKQYINLHLKYIK